MAVLVHPDVINDARESLGRDVVERSPLALGLEDDPRLIGRVEVPSDPSKGRGRNLSRLIFGLGRLVVDHGKGVGFPSGPLTRLTKSLDPNR